MRIEQSDVNMRAGHEFSSEYEYRVDSESNFRQIFTGISGAMNVPTGEDEAHRDGQLILLIKELIARLMEYITGQRDSKVTDLREVMGTGRTDLAAENHNARPVTEMEWTTHITETVREHERTDFQSSGKVRTTDGRTLEFTVDLGMCRDFYCERESTKSGKIVLRDPLVINFSGRAAELSGKRFAFDLDSDGSPDSMLALASGSGYLAFDVNADGRINDGSELFGACSGDGFAELARLDEDGNHWLDEQDSGFAALRIWQRSETGEDLLTPLSERNIGAIYLKSAATPFAITDQDNRMLAAIRASGVYLTEEGIAGTIQQLDVSV